MNVAVTFDNPRGVKLTVEAFEILHRAGALDRHRRAELIDGSITEMSPLGMRHSIVMTEVLVRLHEALRALGSDIYAMSSPTIAIPPHDAPEPDITLAIFNGIGDGYVAQGSVALVIEVSVSTLRYDLSVKRAVYARGDLPEYWVIDPEGGQVHQFWSPIGGTYRQTRVVPLVGELRSATMPDLAIDGSGIL